MAESGPAKEKSCVREDLIKAAEAAALKLSKAIELGDRETAARCTEILVEQCALVSVKLKKEVYPKTEIRLRVGVEDSQVRNIPITINVLPYMTIASLKDKVYRDYGFHTKVQKWIIGQRLAKDQETLYSHNIKRDGDMAFLYLLSAKQANLTRRQHEEDQRLLQPGALSTDGNEDSVEATQTEEVLPGLEARGTQNPEVNKRYPTQEQPAAQPALPVGWVCVKCTYMNKPTRPGCEMCSEAKPDNYKIPDIYQPDEEEVQRIKDAEDSLKHYKEFVEQERKQNYQQLLQTDDLNLISTGEDFDCPVCFMTLASGEGVTLRECLHSFCKECLKGTILNSGDADVTCPFMDDQYSCDKKILEREIKSLLTDEEYRGYLDKSLAIAENRSENSYHCQTVDCRGWCIYEDDVNEFQCPLCKKKNCLLCKAIHEEMNCQQYQDDLKIRALNDDAARQTAEMLITLLKEGEAMHCPKCKIVVQKKDGCDWISCSMCKTEICWVTKGPRWGPLGRGDTSGGCRCRVSGALCHVNCQNCH
ncbi:ranBP-type and C3HC4-type zinc finger-containing protein 1 [Callorhinchus milii]|uniref:RanBP-type and C3HC4-type zinc finger-containing protein 1 n=1 Tax=Callorhinchus milii TaxID=7868 RepID=A0A4W3GRI7_CALMI|nr:ranBP-type and C3HC4-type zinc finger-containing protein 1 [Callorhinchus milii]|eukprot:gi/632980135/ref/XP_007906862.1/ PREDICTED: ranBP-type and C3HC4-type zinc finger-containing protein 1 [Callorhinchus milii]